MNDNNNRWWQFWKSQNTTSTQLNLPDPQDLTPEQNQIIDEVLMTLQKDARSYNINPYDVSNSDMLSSIDSNSPLYYIDTDNEGRLSTNTLRNLSRHPIVSSIIQTRVNQCAEFAQFTPDEDLGFRIVLRDHEEEPSDEDKKRIKEITSFVQNCGNETIDFELTFENFIRQIIRDSLIYDQACFEIVRNRRGDVTGFIPVDASTIRRAKITKEEANKGRRDPDRIAYIQVINNKVVSSYKQNELCFGVRRPRTDISAKKYGYPELEELIATMNNLQSAEIFNASNFNNGISANGIIAVKSKMDPKLFRAFRREFYQMLTGVNNAKRTPLIQLDPESGEEINSINLSTSNREMEYNAWVSYLIKTACSVFQMDPAEIGFVFGSEGQSSSLIQADPATRVIMGKEKGLRPLIRSIQSWINKYIIWQIDDRFAIEFTGMDSLSQKEKINLEEHKMKYMTLNEIRAQHDLEEVADGNVIAAYYGELKKAAMKEGIDPEADVEIEDVEKSKKKRTKLTQAEEKAREKEKERRAELDEPVYKPLPGDENVETKPSKYTRTKLAEAVREEMKESGKDEFIRAASKVSGVAKRLIEQVYDRGLAAWEGSHRPGATAQQWAKARVYSFLTGGKTQSTADKDLWEDHLEDKKKKKTIDSIIDNHYEAFEKLAEDDYLEKAETYRPPNNVANEAKRGIKAIEEHNSDAGTQVGRTRARQLANKTPVSEQTIRRMKSFFDRHEKNKEIAEGKEWYEDNGFVSWLLWGGDSGREWAERMVQMFNERDEKKNK